MSAAAGKFAIWILVAFLTGALSGTPASAAERAEHFDSDPGWDARNNRIAVSRTVRQDFGYDMSSNRTGAGAGELGGKIHPAAEPACYAMKIPEMTFHDRLAASGSIYIAPGSGHFLLGFFNADTINEWRTPNAVSIRIEQRGEGFHCYVEYGTSKWRSRPEAYVSLPGIEEDGDPPKRELPAGHAYDWSLTYDPLANGGDGSVAMTFAGETVVCDLLPGHKADGAVFNRFGLLNVMKHWESPGEAWIGNLKINGETIDLSRDPGWEELRNRREYETSSVRPSFDFGYSSTSYAGGESSGEIGGTVYMGDCREPDRLACYGDRLSTLTLEMPLKASGKFVLRRAPASSRFIFGFFHSRHSMQVNSSQRPFMPMDFLGIAIDALAREGLYFSPHYRVHGDGHNSEYADNSPYIYPDGMPHDWSLKYDPDGAGGNGSITMTFDDKTVTLGLAPGDKATGAYFDRFGIVTTWVDGNGQEAYLDDLTYTCSQGSSIVSDAE